MGGAIYFASQGLSDSIVQAIGHWFSTAWKFYICNNPTVRAEQQLASICLLTHFILASSSANSSLSQTSHHNDLSLDYHLFSAMFCSICCLRGGEPRG